MLHVHTRILGTKHANRAMPERGAHFNSGPGFWHSRPGTLRHGGLDGVQAIDQQRGVSERGCLRVVPQVIRTAEVEQLCFSFCKS